VVNIETYVTSWDLCPLQQECIDFDLKTVTT